GVMDQAMIGLSFIPGGGAVKGAGLMCRAMSAAEGAMKGMAIGGFVGAGQGSILGYAATGTWNGAWDGMGQGFYGGLAMGGIGGAMHGFFNPTSCFTANTEVVTAMEIEDDDGTIRPITARRLSTMDKMERVGLLPRVVRYLTTPITLLKEGD